MPPPFLPPDPDQPAPTLYEAPGGILAFPLGLTGMDPWDEQKQISFEFKGKPGAVFVPIELSASSHKYSGVGIGQLAGAGSTFKYDFSGGGGAPKSGNLNVTPATFGGKVTTVVKTAAPPKVSFAVTYIVDPTPGWFAVAVPYMETLPAYGSMAAYKAAWAFKPVNQTSGTVTLKTTPGQANRYAIFMAKDLPGAVTPHSPPVVKLI